MQGGGSVTWGPGLPLPPTVPWSPGVPYKAIQADSRDGYDYAHEFL